MTLPMRVMPPRMTSATRAVETAPVTQGAIPNSVRKVSATVLAWMALPVRNAVVPSIRAKNMASGLKRGPRPRSM